MKIRLISDLHLDINAGYDLDFKAEGLDDMFTIVAGDICGSPIKAAQWLEYNLSQGAFVSGNHDVYETDMAIEDVKKFFASKFPESLSITYFDNDIGVISKDIGENVLLVADVMYTDYTFKAGFRNPDGDVKRNIVLADIWRNGRYGMNDFRYGTCKKVYPGINDDKPEQRHRLVPEFYLEHFEKAFKAMTDVIERNQDKDVIVVTHHCLSPKCIDDEHADSSVVASYVSDKEDWIKSHPNIRCVCSGHIHDRKSFKVGNALYVMNSLGYCSEQLRRWSAKVNDYVFWTPDCIIDTSSWTVDFKEHKMPAWTSKYEHDNDKFMKYAPFFM